jgi:methionine synthase II (cobalamin-independent)
MTDVEFGCRPTIIGTMPHNGATEACDLIVRHLKDIPAWPQLPQRGFLENMYVQFSEGFPGVVLEGLGEERKPGSERIYVDRSQDLSAALERLYAAYLDNKPEEYRITEQYAAGLHHFLARAPAATMAVKGHVTGPVSWGLTVTDQERRPIIYDDTLADAAARMLRMKAAWQENELKKVNRNTIMFVDEPYLSSYGSAFFSMSRDRVVALIEEVLGGISGLKGIHCCGNTDWSVLLGTSLNIINFDAYNYAKSLSLYPDEVGRFLSKSGTIAWGIVPTFPESLGGETVSSLRDRLEEAMAPFTRHGIPFRQLVRQGLLTPSCGLATLKASEAAERALELLTGLSDVMRRRYL